MLSNSNVRIHALQRRQSGKSNLNLQGRGVRITKTSTHFYLTTCLTGPIQAKKRKSFTLKSTGSRTQGENTDHFIALSQQKGKIARIFDLIPCTKWVHKKTILIPCTKWVHKKGKIQEIHNGNLQDLLP